MNLEERLEKVQDNMIIEILEIPIAEITIIKIIYKDNIVEIIILKKKIIVNNLILFTNKILINHKIKI